MTRSMLGCLAVAVFVMLSILLPSGAASTDRILLDAPRGAWLGSVRADASLVVIEERDGWRHVRLEGWMPVADAAGPARDISPGGPGPGGSASGVPASATSAPKDEASAGASVRGALLPAADRPGGTAGTGLIVLLLSDLPALDHEHSAAGGECRVRLKEVDDRLETLRDELTRALNGSSNLRQATERSDRLKLEIGQVGQDRARTLRECRATADTIMEKHSIAKTISDGSGTFQFDHVAQGRYRVFATDAGSDQPRAWLLDCAVADASARIILDPRRDRAAVDPYWGLR